MMQIKLKQFFAPHTQVDSFDVRQVKKALNRLGYYQPYASVGITDFPDTSIFSAIKAFQRDQNLSVTGEIRPDDETFARLNAEIGKKQAGSYIWRSVEDAHVRASHARYNRTLRDWSETPDPGEDFNCRCWAQPLQDQIDEIDDTSLEPVYPELLLIPATKAKTILNLLAVPVAKTISSKGSSKIRMDDTNTWPRPPVSGKLKEGLPSRQKPRNRGEKSLFDERGGEWRYAKEDDYHNPHWDHKSSPSSAWKNIPINSKPTQKNGK